MKATEIIKELSIPRTTFYRYVDKGLIKAKKLPNGRYVYDNNSVQKLKKKLFTFEKDPKKIVLYQTGEYLKSIQSGSKTDQNKSDVKIDLTFTDYSSNLKFENKTDLNNLINSILEDRIDTVYLPNKEILGSPDIYAMFSLICHKKKVNLKLLKSEGKNNG